MRERVTAGGAAYILAMALTGLAAFASANNLLFLLLAAMVAALMVSGFISRLGIAGLELDIQLPEHISARRPAAARVVLKNEKRLVPSFSIHLAGVDDSAFTTQLYFPVVPGGGRAEAGVDMTFQRRGIHAGESFQFSSRFPFGFAERRVQVRMTREVLVYPALDAQPGFQELLDAVEGDAESLFRGLGHDFHRIRPYVPFESARHVDWRATAHTGALQVREFAREQERLVTIFLDLNAPDGRREWFEQAVECAAFLAWRLCQRGARVRFRTQEFEILTPVEGDVYAILRYLALAAPRPGVPPLKNLHEESAVVVFSAAAARLDDAGWSGARVADLARLPRGLTPDA
jgi:uncharacterized protein (DUF58 family)